MDLIALNSMTAKEQWQWIVKSDIKDKFKIELDNDSTYLTFEDSYINLKSDIGNRQGAIHLLESLGIKVELV